MKMTFRALQAVPAVRLHAKDMNITKVSVKQLPQATALELFNRFTQSGDDKDFLDIMLTGALVANQITLYEMIIEYKGKLNEELDGFYRSSYVNYRGDTVWEFHFSEFHMAKTREVSRRIFQFTLHLLVANVFIDIK